ncbi:MAG: ComEC/Rec2 family competence protein [Desulfobacterales bacterium]|nr:ComEC/Rec2 family competence protein [Desulfobacterales bacterium]
MNTGDNRAIPFSWMGLSLILGTLAGTYGSGALPQGPGLWGTLVFFAMPLWQFRHRRVFIPLFLATLALLAFWNAGLAAQRPEDAIERWIPEHTEAARRKFYAVEGTVVTLPEEKQTGRRRNLAFILEAEQLTRYENGGPENFRVRGRTQVFCFQPAVFPRPGDRVRLYGDLQRPAPPANPGQFDYRDYLRKRGIEAVLQVYGPASLRVVKNGNPGWVLRTAHAARQALAQRIERLFSEKAAALLKALLIGMRRELDPGLRDDFMRTGTAQVLPTPIRKWDHNPLASHFTAQTISYRL